VGGVQGGKHSGGSPCLSPPGLAVQFDGSCRVTRLHIPRKRECRGLEKLPLLPKLAPSVLNKATRSYRIRAYGLIMTGLGTGLVCW